MGTRNQTNVEEVTFFLYTWHANLDISALLPTTLVSANIWRCIGECCGSGLPLVQAIRVALSVEKRKAMIKLSQPVLFLLSCREILNLVSDTISLLTLMDQAHCSCIPLGFLANTSMSPFQSTRIEVRALIYFSQLLFTTIDTRLRELMCW